MHDFKGKELNEGDIVIIPCRVKSLFATPDYCNVNLESIASMPPDRKHRLEIGAINTQQVVRANEGDDTSFGIASGPGGTELVALK